MAPSMRLRLRLRVAIAVLVLSSSMAIPAAAADRGVDGCTTVDEVIAYQEPGKSVLTGRVYTPDVPILTGWVSTLDGSQQVPLDNVGWFELPLGTKSGEWYVSSMVTWDCEAQFQPAAPYLANVRNLTRITPTTADQSVPYGEQITVAGLLEGWTQATGWQPLASRPLDVWRYFYDPAPVKVSTDAGGAYTARVEALEISAAGSAHFAGDDTWLRSEGNAFVWVFARITASVSDASPKVGQPVRVIGRVAPGSVPVRLEEFRGGNWRIIAGPVTADANGRYVLRYRPTIAGPRQMQALTDGTISSSAMEGVAGNQQHFTVDVHH